MPVMQSHNMAKSCQKMPTYVYFGALNRKPWSLRIFSHGIPLHNFCIGLRVWEKIDCVFFHRPTIRCRRLPIRRSDQNRGRVVRFHIAALRNRWGEYFCAKWLAACLCCTVASWWCAKKRNRFCWAIEILQATLWYSIWCWQNQGFQPPVFPVLGKRNPGNNGWEKIQPEWKFVGNAVAMRGIEWGIVPLDCRADFCVLGKVL